ncbi:MAG: hypothetical protein ACO35F_11300, partial [Ilumatobacteraceae bacterium]
DDYHNVDDFNDDYHNVDDFNDDQHHPAAAYCTLDNDHHTCRSHHTPPSSDDAAPGFHGAFTNHLTFDDHQHRHYSGNVNDSHTHLGVVASTRYGSGYFIFCSSVYGSTVDIDSGNSPACERQ